MAIASVVWPFLLGAVEAPDSPSFTRTSFRNQSGSGTAALSLVEERRPGGAWLMMADGWEIEDAKAF